MRLIRVFPRRTKATPIDRLAYVGSPDMFAEADEVHISVAFSWDMHETEKLYEQWRKVAPTTIGGPATGMPGGDFIPGVYLKPGYVITSRGCPNRCWFCEVWKREGGIRELPITDGWNVLDDNLLACSEEHIRNVFAMLKRQRHPKEFTGGWEAARLQDWHVDLLADLKPRQVFFAYDTPDDFEPLREAGKKLQRVGLKIRNPLRAFVLIGYPKDTIDAAEQRMYETIDAGFMPMAMLYRDKQGKRDPTWAKFQHSWCRPAAMAGKI